MSGNISCSQCGYKLSEQDMFCGQCGMPRDRGSNATLRSNDSQVSTALVTPPSPGNILTPAKPSTAFSQQSKSLDVDNLYREGLIAQSRDDLEQAVSLWQQVVDKNPNYGGETFKLQRRKLLQELHLKRAKQAQNAGEWEREIEAWEALWRLEPQDKIKDEAKNRLSIARHNQGYIWMYKNAERFIAEGNLSEARNLLKELRRQAPYYGDPEKLAKKASMRVPLDPYKKEKIKSRIRPIAVIASLPLAFGVDFLLALLLRQWNWNGWIVIALFILMFIITLVGLPILSLYLFRSKLDAKRKNRSKFGGVQQPS